MRYLNCLLSTLSKNKCLKGALTEIFSFSSRHNKSVVRTVLATAIPYKRGQAPSLIVGANGKCSVPIKREVTLKRYTFLLLPFPSAKVILSARRVVNSLSCAGLIGCTFQKIVHFTPSEQGGVVKDPEQLQNSSPDLIQSKKSLTSTMVCFVGSVSSLPFMAEMREVMKWLSFAPPIKTSKKMLMTANELVSIAQVCTKWTSRSRLAPSIVCSEGAWK